MAYSMLNTKTFIELVKKGNYDTKTGARRALGKTRSIPEEDKAKCQKAIDDFFGADEKPAKKPAAKKPVVKKEAAPKKAPKAPKEKPAKKQKAKRASVATPAVGPQDSIMVGAHVVGMFDDVNSITTQLRIAEKTIQNAGSVMSILLEAKRVSSEIDVAEAIERTAITLTGAVNIFDNITNKVASALVKQQDNAAAAAATPPNGGSGKTLFQEALPSNV